ncbi:integrase core domain-containing protein, partial [Streptomyces sp. NPDC001758]
SALDNAAAESFNSLIKVEYIHRHQFATRTEAPLKIATWITGFYNMRRRHSAAGGLPPVEFEQIISRSTRQPPSGGPGRIRKVSTLPGD